MPLLQAVSSARYCHFPEVRITRWQCPERSPGKGQPRSKGVLLRTPVQIWDAQIKEVQLEAAETSFRLRKKAERVCYKP